MFIMRDGKRVELSPAEEKRFRDEQAASIEEPVIAPSLASRVAALEAEMEKLKGRK